MRILLTTLNSRYIHSNLALKYLYTAGVKVFPELELREFTINSPEDYIYMELVRGKYDVICFSCYVWNIEKIKYLCENLKKARPELRIVLGGPEVSFDCEEFLRENEYVDAVIFGEGEVTFNLMLRAILSGSPKFPDILGLAYRAEDQIFMNEPRPLLELEEMPFPYEVLPVESDKIVYYESSRGCPYGCTYCMSSLEKGVRKLSLERTMKELKYFLYMEVKQVKFIDRTFNWDEERTLRLLEFLIRNDNGITNFHFELCGSLITERFLAAVDRARPGLFQFEIGVQTTNELTLSAVNRNENPEDVLRNIRRLAALGGSHIHVDLITGLPFENLESLKISFNNIYPVGADVIQVGFLKLLKGTAIRDEYEFYDYVHRSRAPYEIISNVFMTSMDIIRIKQLEEVLDLFYNKGGFEYTLECLIDILGKSPFDFYLELADYYYLKGYQDRNHSKDDMYRIMHGFISWKERYSGRDMDKAYLCLEKDLRYRLGDLAADKFIKKGWNLPEE